jgi:hypothetical protein
MFITVKIANAGACVGQPHAFFQWRVITESRTVILYLESQQSIIAPRLDLNATTFGPRRYAMPNGILNEGLQDHTRH